MAAKNSRIVVATNEPDGGSAVRYDVVMGCDWVLERVGNEHVLHVHAWRNGVKTRIATYSPPDWHSIAFQAAIRD